MELTRWGELGWEDEAISSSAWGLCCQALNEGKVAFTPQKIHTIFARDSNPNSSSPGGVHHRFRLGAASHTYVGANSIGQSHWDVGSKESSIEGVVN